MSYSIEHYPGGSTKQVFGIGLSLDAAAAKLRMLRKQLGQPWDLRHVDAVAGTLSYLTPKGMVIVRESR